MFISWINYHGRSQELAEKLGVDAQFLEPADTRRNLIRRYASAIRWTISTLRATDSNSVYLMLPPAPALLTVLLFKGRNRMLVADLHTGFFLDSKWKWFTPLGLRLLRNSVALVTNEGLRAKCEAAGVRSIVLHDILEDRTKDPVAQRPDGSDLVLCPLSYANDEPVDQLLQAARQCPDLKFVFTGKAPQAVRDQAPKNVHFTGFVKTEDYLDLLNQSSAVVALTTRDLTMQRAGYEALMYGKPQVTSNFVVLREFLGEAAHYVDPYRSGEIADALRAISQDSSNQSRTAVGVLNDRIREQSRAIEELKSVTR
ncbi:glycosyltransferase [Rhodococcus sp. ARC_M6]|uniref:glycosyltransferase n=1 Tax=Rhodococcus sp. ARC_M6 TaxID=2928852 RepID=UPI001FB28CE6|nr:glycosyltransferase [Rhodococcus sp. ARC_M6]MCJ0902130.1 glycosyltransferase [Rhodococcus sp. ARC_M6]